MRIEDSSWRGEKVLVIESWDLSPHLETGLEIALRLSECGAEVDYRFIGRDLYNVESNQGWNPLLRKVVWRSGVNQGLSVARKFAADESLGVTFGFQNAIDKSTSKVEPNLRNDEAIGSFVIDECRVGLGVLSSIISLKRDPMPNLARNRNLVKKLTVDCYRTLSTIHSLLDSGTYSTVVVFNGRFAVQRVIADCSRSRNLRVLFHERGATQERFWLEDFQTHDLTRCRSLMKSLWDSALTRPDSDASVVARSFFERRRSGDGISWCSFIDNQVPGRLAAELPQVLSQKVFAFYTSSDDELKATGYKNSDEFWKNQFAMIRDVYELAESRGALFVIRVHPHLSSKSKQERRRWSRFLREQSKLGTLVIRENDSISTYELLDNTNVVFTAGSTIGAEAVYWGKPSVCFGESLYGYEGSGVLTPSTLEEMYEKFDDYCETETRSESILPYGYFSLTFGEEFKFYRPATLWEGQFLGVRLSQPRWPAKKLKRFIKLLRSGRSKAR